MFRRLIRILIAASLLLVPAVALTPSPVAASTCVSKTAFYEWDNNGVAHGEFWIKGTGCFNGTTATGTAITTGHYSGTTAFRSSGPSYYTDGSGNADFWENMYERENFNGLPHGTGFCQLNMYPRLKLSKSGAWSTDGTDYNQTRSGSATCTDLQARITYVGFAP